MKNEMEKIDQIIKEALTQEEVAFYDELEEQGLFGQIGELHKGKTGWISIIMIIVNLIILGVFIYSLTNFLKVETTDLLIKWGALGFLCVILSSVIKICVWMQINKQAVLRELKRLELQLASFAVKK